MSEPTPTPAPKKGTLDTAANIAIILVCAIAAVVLIRNQFFPPRPPGPPAVEKGEQYAQLKAALPPGAQRALFVAVQPQCHFCNDSLPFYKTLVDQRNQKGSNVKFVALVPSEQTKAEEAAKFAGAGVNPDGVAPVNFADIKVPGTPTMMLVDNQGKVLDVWVGKLDKDGEQEVLEKL